jgi:hypothetical protein
MNFPITHKQHLAAGPVPYVAQRKGGGIMAADSSSSESNSGDSKKDTEPDRLTDPNIGRGGGSRDTTPDGKK